MRENKEVSRIIKEVLERKILEKAVFSRAFDKNKKKAVAKLFSSQGDILCQIEVFTSDNKAHHENLTVDVAAVKLAEMAMNEYVQTDIYTSAGFCEILVSKKGHTHIANRISENPEALASTKNLPDTISSHNRKKNYILDPEAHAEFLNLLGVADQKGRVFEKKSSKFKQINRFIELLDDVYDKLPDDGKLCVCDLCCGKSYLTFAVYYYLTKMKHRSVKMYGVDLKRDVIEYCNEIAGKLSCEGLEFICGDINKFHPEERVDMVVSLHACDIATDIVLDFAVKNSAKVILSTPCCHHEMMKQISCEELSFITDHSMLKQKLCDAATDAMRALKLEAYGYSVEVLELIDAEETPKNVMLRAFLPSRLNKDKMLKAREKYLSAKEFLNISPFLSL